MCTLQTSTTYTCSRSRNFNLSTNKSTKMIEELPGPLIEARQEQMKVFLRDICLEPRASRKKKEVSEHHCLLALVVCVCVYLCMYIYIYIYIYINMHIYVYIHTNRQVSRSRLSAAHIVYIICTSAENMGLIADLAIVCYTRTHKHTHIHTSLT